MKRFTGKKRLDSRLSNEMTKIPTIPNHNKQVNLTHRPRQSSKKKICLRSCPCKLMIFHEPSLIPCHQISLCTVRENSKQRKRI